LTTKPPSSKPRSKPSGNKLSLAPSAQPNSVPPSEDDAGSLAALEELVSPSELSVVFQPIVSMRSGAIFANEALVRCSVPELSNPMVLFEKAMAKGCVGRLGRIIREIGVPLGEGKPMFVNIHPAELSEGWLVQPDDPIFSHDDDVYLEVTESVPMSHYELCMGVLKEVGSRGGVWIVVDDLGAGYSNLLRIAEMEPRIVKLDRALVSGLDKNKRKRDLVAAVVDLCMRLDAKVVAEGIETEGEFRVLRESGAHYGQGWLFARAAFPPPPIHWPADAASTLVPPTPVDED
jgi:EAL domain-containing protein (putative c-di-GMP-specific phosphodiesterase class I)